MAWRPGRRDGENKSRAQQPGPTLSWGAVLVHRLSNIRGPAQRPEVSLPMHSPGPWLPWGQGDLFRCLHS